MDTVVHIINVGQGNMVWIHTASGKNIFFDCNITDENEDDVLQYIYGHIGSRLITDVFICSHRDNDHLCGISTLNHHFPIKIIKDSDYPGTSTMSDDYQTYMRLRREVGHRLVEKQTLIDYGATRLRFLSAQDKRLLGNANAQGVVIKVEHRSPDKSIVRGSIMLPADSDAATWRYGIERDYAAQELKSNLLMAGHHGALSFFDDPADEKHYYLNHVRSIKPEMTLISVGKNGYGHPDATALKFYNRESTGSNKGNTIKRTDQHGHMKIVLRDAGGWSLNVT